jgi:glycosyltransferase involved in cell wall biosynthesis
MDNAVGDIEVILVLDGDVPDYELPEDKRIRVYHNSKVQGLRPCLNAAVGVARGKYILKVDAHCIIGEGWDKILKADCEDNWIVIPRRYWFDAPTWSIIEDRPLVDCMQYIYPRKRAYKPRLTARPWPERAEEYKDEMLIEDMSYQGSMWFMHREHWHRIGGMDPKDGYGTFGEEPQELGLKTQLGPWEGKIMRNKNTWYAHWSKPQWYWTAPPDAVGRVPYIDFKITNLWAYQYWWNNRYPEQVHTFQWLIDKFWPLPQWPENWRQLEGQYTRHELADTNGINFTPTDETQFQAMTL